MKLLSMLDEANILTEGFFPPSTFFYCSEDIEANKVTFCGVASLYVQ